MYAGLLFSADIVGNYTEWVFHHMAASVGHPGELDKPMDFAFRRAPSEALLVHPRWLQCLDIVSALARLQSDMSAPHLQSC